MITPLLSPASHLVIDIPNLTHSGHVHIIADQILDMNQADVFHHWKIEVPKYTGLIQE